MYEIISKITNGTYESVKDLDHDIVRSSTTKHPDLYMVFRNIYCFSGALQKPFGNLFSNNNNKKSTTTTTVKSKQQLQRRPSSEICLIRKPQKKKHFLLLFNYTLFMMKCNLATIFVLGNCR